MNDAANDPAHVAAWRAYIRNDYPTPTDAYHAKLQALRTMRRIQREYTELSAAVVNNTDGEDAG